MAIFKSIIIKYINVFFERLFPYSSINKSFNINIRWIAKILVTSKYIYYYINMIITKNNDYNLWYLFFRISWFANLAISSLYVLRKFSKACRNFVDTSFQLGWVLTIFGITLLINDVRVLFVSIRVRKNKIRDCSESIFAKLDVSFVEI